MPLGFNPLAMIRMQNLFAPPQQEDDIPNIDTLYHPSTRFSDMYAQSLGQMPNREDYQPSGLRKIGAVLAGIASNNPAQTSNQLASLPFTTAMSDWGQKTKNLEQAAELENRKNVNERTLALGTIQRAIQEKRANTYEDKTQAAIRTANQNAETARMRAETAAKRADVYAKIARGGVIKQDKKGNYFIVYKDGTTESTDLQGWSAGELESLKTQGHLQEIGARDEASRRLEDQREKNRETLRKIPPMRPEPSHSTTRTNYKYDDSGNIVQKNVETGTKEEKRVQVRDKKTGKVIGTIPEADIDKVNKEKYEVVK